MIHSYLNPPIPYNFNSDIRYIRFKKSNSFLKTHINFTKFNKYKLQLISYLLKKIEGDLIPKKDEL